MQEKVAVKMIGAINGDGVEVTTEQEEGIKGIRARIDTRNSKE